MLSDWKRAHKGLQNIPFLRIHDNLLACQKWVRFEAGGVFISDIKEIFNKCQKRVKYNAALCQVFEEKGLYICLLIKNYGKKKR